MVSQPDLAAGLFEAAFALHLQAIPEAYSISVSEAMAAGAIVVASPAGALADRIVHRRNGLLIAGHYEDPSTIANAVKAILGTSGRRMEKIRARAAAEVLDWDAVAELWEQYLQR
jgi:glycosyltransferase involved in cell wall biosynthesis